MPRRKKTAKIDESQLTKGQARKLQALRNSLGADIADRAFAEWLVTQPATATDGVGDPTADAIAEELMRLVEREGLSIPRSGYLVRRGRGRVLVEATTEAG